MIHIVGFGGLSEWFWDHYSQNVSKYGRGWYCFTNTWVLQSEIAKYGLRIKVPEKRVCEFPKACSVPPSYPCSWGCKWRGSASVSPQCKTQPQACPHPQNVMKEDTGRPRLPCHRTRKPPWGGTHRWKRPFACQRQMGPWGCWRWYVCMIGWSGREDQSVSWSPQWTGLPGWC